MRERFVPARPVTTIVSDTVVGTVHGAWATVQMPFEDLNLKRQAIPEKLQQLMDHPYALPPQMLCEGISKEIAELDILLGPDVCTIDHPTGTTVVVSRKGEYIDQGATFARDQAVGIVRGKIDVIPFRGVVRKITGAEKHAKEVERAYQAGRLRRAFLKGLAASFGPGCLNAMTAPLPVDQPKNK
jgi:hypothetical protein